MKLTKKIFISLINLTLTSLTMDNASKIPTIIPIIHSTPKLDDNILTTKITINFNNSKIIHCRQKIEHSITVKHATTKELPAINTLCFNNYHNSGFKEALRLELSGRMTTENFSSDRFINKEINKFAEGQDLVYQSCIQSVQNNHYLLIVTKKHSALEELIGYCSFAKINSEQISIGHIVIRKTYRRKGIGRYLIQKAFKQFPGTTSCNFLWLAKDQTMKELFEKYCTETNTLYMDYYSSRMIDSPTQEYLDSPEILPIEMKKFVFKLKDIEKT